MLKYIQERNERSSQEKAKQVDSPLTDKLLSSATQIPTDKPTDDKPPACDDPYLSYYENENTKPKESSSLDPQRWKYLDDVFSTCPCGKTHDSICENRLLLLATKNMMTSFGDTEITCDEAADEIITIITTWIKPRLVALVASHPKLTLEVKSSLFIFEEYS